MHRFVCISTLALALVGCRHAPLTANDAALHTWRSPHSSLQQRADAVNNLIPQGTRREEVERALGKRGVWTRFWDAPVFRYVYEFPDGGVSLQFEYAMVYGDRFWTASPVETLYHNAQYGLSFFLPASWRHYSFSVQQLQDEKYSSAEDTQVVVGHTPMIILRHPQWQATAPSQDIPILVFTRDQWDALHCGKLWPSAFAGGTMNELWHNQRFVFAMSSRYNAQDEVSGWKEVGEIVRQNCAENQMPHLYPE